MKRFNSATRLVLAVVVVVGLAHPATAGDPVPFGGRLGGELADRTPGPAPGTFYDRWEMAGAATQLGRFELVLDAVVDFRTAPPTGEGTATFVAANGDTLVAEFYGHSEPVAPGVVRIIEYGTVTGGTGRFAGASGSYTCKRLFDLATGETVGSFQGTISVPGR
jgi:hypothetical protein